MKTYLNKFFASLLMFSFGVQTAMAKNPLPNKAPEYTLKDMEKALGTSFASYSRHQSTENFFKELAQNGIQVSEETQKTLSKDIKAPAPQVKLEGQTLTLTFNEADGPKTVTIEVKGTPEKPVVLVNNVEFSGAELSSMKTFKSALLKKFSLRKEATSFNILNLLLPMAHADDDGNEKEGWFTKNLGWLLIGTGALVGIFTKQPAVGIGLGIAGAAVMLGRSMQDKYPDSSPTGGKSEH